MNQKTNSGCLFTFLKILGAFLIFPIILGFGWIAGIVWLLFFRSKMNHNPIKQKKYTINITIASAVSFILFIYSVVLAPPTPTSLSLVSEFEGQLLEVNRDYNMNLEYEPTNASLTQVTYQIDKPSLATITSDPEIPSTLTLHTFGEGTICITAKHSGRESNILTFQITDPGHNNEETPVTEATETITNEEEILIDEEDTITYDYSSDTPTINEQPIEDTEQENGTESNSTYSDEQTNDQTANPIVSSSASISTTDYSTTEPIGELVWISATGSKYHKVNNCGNMNPNKATQMSLQNAAGKYEPCKKCY